MLIVRELQDRVTGADPEHRYQSHHGSERNPHSGSGDREDAADQAERQIRQHQPAVDPPMKRNEQDYQNQSHRERGVEYQFVARLLFRGSGAGVLEVHPGRKRNGCGYSSLRLLYHCLERSAADVERHAYPALPTVMFDAVAILRHIDPGDLRQRYSAEGTCDQEAGKLRRLMPQNFRQQHRDFGGAAATLAPVASRTSRSSPNTLIATCAVSPLRLSLMRSPRNVTTSLCMPG